MQGRWAVLQRSQKPGHLPSVSIVILGTQLLSPRLAATCSGIMSVILQTREGKREKCHPSRGIPSQLPVGDVPEKPADIPDT